MAHSEVFQHDHCTALTQPIRRNVQGFRNALHRAPLLVETRGRQHMRPLAVGRIIGRFDADPSTQPVKRRIGRGFGPRQQIGASHPVFDARHLRLENVDKALEEIPARAFALHIRVGSKLVLAI